MENVDMLWTVSGLLGELIGFHLVFKHRQHIHTCKTAFTQVKIKLAALAQIKIKLFLSCCSTNENARWMLKISTHLALSILKLIVAFSS